MKSLGYLYFDLPGEKAGQQKITCSAEILDLKHQDLLPSNDVPKHTGESFRHLPCRHYNLIHFQDIPICPGHLRAIRGSAGVGNKIVAGDACDDNGVVFGTTGPDDNRIGRAQAVKGRYAHLVEVRANLAE